MLMPSPDNTQLFGCFPGKINQPISGKWPPVVNSYINKSPIIFPGNFHHGAKWKRAMCGSHLFLIEYFSTCRSSAVKALPIIRCNTSLPGFLLVFNTGIQGGPMGISRRLLSTGGVNKEKQQTQDQAGSHRQEEHTSELQ